MFNTALLAYGNAISVQRTNKFYAAKAIIGFAALVELIIKVSTIFEAVKFFTEMGHHLLNDRGKSRESLTRLAVTNRDRL